MTRILHEIGIEVPYFIYAKKCHINVPVDKELFDIIIKKFSNTNRFSFIDDGKRMVVSMEFSDMIPAETWEIGGEIKSPYDRWEIACVIHKYTDKAMQKFTELTGVE